MRFCTIENHIRFQIKQSTVHEKNLFMKNKMLEITGNV